MRRTRRNRINTPCAHKFHNKCLIQWAKRSNTCPMCRAPGMRHVVRRDMADALVRLRFAIRAFVEASTLMVQPVRHFPMRMFPFHFWQDTRPETVRVVKTVLLSAYFDKDKRFEAIQSLYLDVVKHAAAVDRKIFRTELSPNAVYRAFYNTFESTRAADKARGVLDSVDFFTVNFGDVNLYNEPNVFALLLLRPSTANLLVPDFAFLKKLVKALRVHDTDGFVKALTKARKQWREAKLVQI